MSQLVRYIVGYFWSKKHCEEDTNDGIENTTVPCCLCVDPQKVCIVETAEEWDLVWPYLKEAKVLGFDCEWITKDRKSQPVSLLQLATLSGIVVLVRLHLLKYFPETLVYILAEKSILKAGVACVDDGKKLLKDYGLQVSGCVDLRNLAHRCRYPHLIGFGLKSLATAVLGVEIDKNPLLRTSNWESDQLSRQQVEYGGKDAVVGAFVFWRLISLKLRSRDYFCTPDDTFWDKASSCCQGLVDLNFKATKKDCDSEAKKGQKANVQAVDYKQRAYVTRQSPLYHNCQMIAPDGQLLCTCDLKKATWYMEKGLATKVKDDPLVIQLTFEPSGRPMEEKNYYNQDKQNICVVCGKDGSYIRKSVIPHEYRKYFPPVMKEHRSHDVLLMCTRCHQESNLHDAGIKKYLSLKCNAPVEKDNTSNKNNQLVQVRSAAKALLRSASTIPAARITELETRIKEYFGVSEISDDLLKRAIQIDDKVVSCHTTSHGQKVVEYISEHEGLLEFEKMWREHFLSTMKPKYLPPMWSVDHHHDQLSNMEDKMKATVKAVHQRPDGSKLKFLMS